MPECEKRLSPAALERGRDNDMVPTPLVVSSHGDDCALPPVDGGKDAWLFLTASFFVEGLTWGFPFAFGVFQKHYSKLDAFAGSPQIAMIGTCAMGIMYLDIPIVMGLQRMYPRLTRWSPMAGLFLVCIAIAASSFSQTPAHLVATQGVLYAIGGSIAYCPCIIYLDEWFVERKGLAYGAMWSGTGLAGFVLPLLLEYMLGRYGFRTTLRAWCILIAVMAAPLGYLIRPRLPPSAKAHLKPFKLAFVLRRSFLLHQSASICQALGFFLPGIYLPTYARDIGAGDFVSALSILLVNVASVFGSAAMGSLVDHLDVTTCLFISALGASVGVFLIWGFATSLPALLVFCVVYGLFGGSYSSTWTGIMRQITAEPTSSRGSPPAPDASLDPAMVLGMLSMGRGIGSIVSGPLSQLLLKDMPWKGQAYGAYGTGYGVLIVFTGLSALLSGLSFVWRRLGLM
ncbi:hypothetical protein CDD82_4241 [Ophiocordyceps australis]|uniref:Major facilitator superfamily (MFS) profile domain-containing protein n=1 Tax=Ophiocordyceps australis TaxID=1399860 RepID=A0A2C5Z814_9HYPO|nr:hypothetical protein CDD82_4241 [Ophiocordyceps australis]